MSTSIPIKKKTRDELRRYGKKGETWDELINRLLSENLPRQPASLEELKKRREEGEYVPLDEAIKELENI